ncbi:MAG: BON domain-containing protein [Dehalococcoidia bacterium]|nr:BON domain-containing protein [Dehalococcoidia bacterium]
MAISSEQIKKEVVDQLYWDSSVDASRVKVEVYDGKVILSGSVPSHSARRAAYRDAIIVPGVTSVDNDLAVEPPQGIMTASDDEIRNRVDNVLLRDPDIDSSDMNVIVDAAWVTLNGTVDAYWKKIRAEDLVSNVTGVLGVTNSLAVVPSESVTDKAIADNIMAELGRNIYIDVNDITLEVEDGFVTLYGRVPNGTAYLAAYNAAAYTPGVIDVNNNLRIE